MLKPVLGLFCFFLSLMGLSASWSSPVAQARVEFRSGGEAYFAPDVSEMEIRRFFQAFEETRNFLIRHFSYTPGESAIFQILQKPGDASLPLWIGGWYEKRRILLQPVNWLWGKNLLEQVVFIEYAHFFIDRYTRFRCPLWLNETLSLYLFRIFSGTRTARLNTPVKNFASFSYFIRLQDHLQSYHRAQTFFLLAEEFAFFIQKRHGKDFWIMVLSDLSRNQPWEKSFTRHAGEAPSTAYENFFSLLP